MNNTGIVKMFNGQFGFIKSNGEDVYFHKSCMIDSEQLTEGSKVEFIIEPSAKKQGSFQANNIRVIERLPNKVIQQTQNRIGLVKWFDVDKGFGIIGTPENEEFFLHSSNINHNQISAGTALVFLPTTEKGKKTAKNTRLLNKTSDWALIIAYLIIPDNVNIDVKVSTVSRGYTRRTTENRSFSLKYYAVRQFFKYQDVSTIENTIIDYFYDNIADKRVELYTPYFNFIKEKIIESGINDNIEKLKKIYQGLRSYIDVDTEYQLWKEGYLGQIDIQIIANKLNSDISSINRILTLVSIEEEKSFILNVFLSKLSKLQPSEIYTSIKPVLNSGSISTSSKKDFLIQAIPLCNKEGKYLLWLDNFTDEIDLDFIVEKIINESVSHSYDNHAKKIFTKIIDEDRQNYILSTFIKKVGIINNSNVQLKIKYIFSLSEISLSAKNDFIIKAFDISDSERKYIFWVEDFTEEIDLQYVADKMANDWQNSFQKIFSRISNEKEQLDLLNLFLNNINCIDNSDKYNKVKSILTLTEVKESVKSELINTSFRISNDGIKYLFWIENYVSEINLPIVAKTMVNEHSTNYYYTNPYKKIFSKLIEDEQKTQLLKIFLDLLGNIHNELEYAKIKNVLNLQEINSSIKNAFLLSVIDKCDDEYKYLLWIEDFIEQVDLDFIVKKLVEIELQGTYLPYGKIFLKISTDENSLYVLNQFLYKIGLIDSDDKYSKVIHILNGIDDTKKSFFFVNIFYKCNTQLKNKLWIEFAWRIEVPNYSQFIEIIIDENDFEGLFVWGTNMLEPLTRINHSYYYTGFSHMKIYYEHPNYITETNNKYGNSSIFKHHGINLNLTHFQRKIEISTCIVNFIGLKKEQYLKQIIEYLQNNETIEEYFFQNVKKYFSNQDVFKEYLSDEIVFTYRDIEHAIINNLPIEKILIFWLKGYVNHEFISNRKEELLNSILQNLNTIKADKNLLKAYVKTLKNKLSDNNKQETNESDELKIQFIEIEKLILENLNVEQILYLWVYALIETFDFNSYCFYYFTLNTTERKIFNKKAKALMGEEIKKSMLKQREPWEFIEESEGVKIFKATWRSIWFANNFIRICVDKDARFSNSYYWNFSEEKFNFLFDYISGRRLKDLTIYVKDEIIKIDGLDDLEEIIWKIQFQREVESSNKLSGSRMTGSNRIPVNMILRNKCIQFLSKLQINGLEPTRVLEKTFFVDKGGSAIDISLLFSIPINNDKEVVIIWESLELEKSKATHIFKCNRNEYDDLFDNVENYLSTKAKVRSTLNSNNFEDVEKQKKLRYVCRIDHDNFHYEKWENQIFEILPELKNNIKN